MSDECQTDNTEELDAKPPRKERRGDERRGSERRKSAPTDFCGTERRTGSERRRSPERRLGGIAGRREEDRKAFEDRVEGGELTLEEVEFIRAIDRYKRKFNRPFPTWSEVLLVIKQLGYTKDSI